ncbi:MAG: prolipoprotein diacylglyceryl transferase [bacterium]
MCPNFELFGSKVELFPIIIALGATLAILLFLRICSKDKTSEQELNKLMILFIPIALGCVFFAMVADKIAHFSQPWYVPAGISFSGGLLGGFVCYSITYYFLFKEDRSKYIKHTSLFIMLATLTHAFGRVGCFFGGCCYGIESDSFLAVTYPAGSIQHIQYGYITAVLPTQLFEAGFLFILFGIMFKFVKKYTISLYFIGYGIFRFFLEYLRGDNRGSLNLSISPSQLYSIIFVIIGIVFIVVEYKEIKKNKEV